MDKTYTDEELERCTIRGQREIAFQLRGLIKQGERLTVAFNQGRQSFLTIPIDIAADGDAFYFDVGGSGEINRAFLNAEQSVFTAFIDGIRIQFSAPQAREATLRGERVFAVPLPKSMLRLQRREFFRLELPMGKPYLCRIRRGTAGEKALPLHDISLGGVGVLSTEPLAFEPLEKLENCWIDLRDSGVLAITLEVRHIETVQSRTGRILWQMGCQFTARTALNETLIQRFMARLEAERKALLA